MEQHFVTFFSPGSFVAETDEKEIESWDVEAAVEMARSITQRYNARPYGFRFTTRSRSDGDLDSHISATGPMYYLGGKIETREEIEARHLPDERILRSNMRSNNYDRVVVNDNSWRWTQPLKPDDVVLDVTL